MNSILKHSSKRSELGLSKITILIFGVLVFTVGFLIYNVMPFYYYYYEFRNQMEALTRVASTHTDQELRRKLKYHIKKMQIPIGIEEVMIVRDGGKIEMSAEYEEVLYITLWDKDYDLHTFSFHAYVERDL